MRDAMCAVCLVLITVLTTHQRQSCLEVDKGEKMVSCGLCLRSRCAAARYITGARGRGWWRLSLCCHLQRAARGVPAFAIIIAGREGLLVRYRLWVPMVLPCRPPSHSGSHSVGTPTPPYPPFHSFLQSLAYSPCRESTFKPVSRVVSRGLTRARSSKEFRFGWMSAVAISKVCAWRCVLSEGRAARAAICGATGRRGAEGVCREKH